MPDNKNIINNNCRTRVKMCGIRTVSEAMSAIASGADALGFVFYDKSPRHVELKVAREICLTIPPFVSTVGLFVNASTETVFSILQSVPLQSLQFHGDESDDYCTRFDKPYYKAIRVQEDSDILAMSENYPHANALLLDAYHADKYGGTGKTFNWDKIPSSMVKPFVLAGGLTSQNIAQAIQQIAPYAVDVSGGVESKPGVKDPAKMVEFMSKINR